MKSDKKAENPVPTPSVEAEQGNPETAFETVNRYGTYNVQATADTENPFPTVAQGRVKKSPRRKRDDS